jgi:hypothetical protein
MTFGLINNGIANMIKFFATVRLGYLRITGQAKGVGDETSYMTNEQLEAAAAAASLDQAHAGLTQRFTAEKVAVDALRASYEAAVAAGNRFATLNPGMMKPGAAAASSAPRMAKGGILKGPGNGTSDSILSWLSNGEAVIPAEVVEENPELIKALIAGGLKIPGFAEGGIAGGAGARKSGKLMVLPGGAEFAHFSEAIRMTGRDLLALAEQSGATQNQLARLKSMVGDQLEATFKTFDSSVERISGELNQLVGEVGSGKSVPKELAERDLVERGRDARSPIMNKMMKDGVSPEDALEKADKITAEVKTRFDLLGDDIQVTAEMINKITKEAYEAVAAVDEDVARAYAEMQKIRTVKDESGARGARGDRFAFGKGSYKSESETIKRVPDKAGFETSYNASGFKTTEEMARIAELTEIEVQQLFKNLPEQVKLAVYDQLKLGTQQFITALLSASEAGVVEGVKSSTQQSSPSKKARQAGENIGKGAIDGIESQIPEAKVAGQKVGTSAVDGVESTQSGASVPRRKTTNGNVIFDEQTGLYQEAAKMAEINIGRQKGLARATQMTINKVSDFAGKASQASFAIGSVAGIATMFGGKIGEVASIIMQVNLLFSALAVVTAKLVAAKSMENTMSLVTGLNNKRAVSKVTPDGRAVAVKADGWFGGAKGKAGMAAFGKNIAELAKSLPIIGRIFAAIGTALAAAAAALGITFGALVVAILAIVAIIVGSVVAYKIARDNVTKLGETANLSAEKLQKLADIFGVTTRSADFAGNFSGTTADTAEEQNKVNMVLESENFEKDFKTQISAIKTASEEDAKRVLNSLAIQLSSSGFEEDAVEAIINAIAIKAGRKDLDLTFSSISFSSPEGLAAISNIANQTMAKLETAFDGRNIWDSLGIGNFTTQLNTSSAELTTAFEALQIGFREGEISAEDLISSMGGLNQAVMSLNPAAAKQLVDQLSKDLGMEDKVSELDNFQDKLLLINASTAGIEIPEKVVKALERASKAGASKKDLEDAVRLRKEINDLIAEEAKKLEEAKEAEEQKAIMTAAVQDAQVSIAEEITNLENEARAYEILTDAGWDAASAIAAVSDATIAQGLASAANAAERQGLINDLAALMQLRAQSDALKSSQTGRGGGGGGATKSAMQEALESLGKQRTEIKNNIAAYAGLRSAGFSAAQAAEAAGDATLAAALASTKVGSKEWKALVNQIRLVRIEALKTSDGIRNAFSGLKNQAGEYYDILERQVERKYADGLKAAEKQAKTLNRAIEDLTDVTEGYQEEVDGIQRDIEIQFDRPIEALNEETSDLANDLSLMDREADKITKRYDEQAEALERVNKINQRIIAQQKQQVGLASALVEGDISAAAAAVQDIRAANAEAAGQSQVDMLNTAKQAELDALRSASGMSRIEIEERQFEISQEIYDLEEQREIKLAAIQVIEDEIYKIQQTQIKPLEDQLKVNEDIVQEIEDQRDVELEAIDAQRQKWEDAELALDNARIEAGEFNNVINMAKGLTGDVVANWKELEDKTIQLTIETVMAELGGPATDAPIVQETGSGGGGGGGTPVTPTMPTAEVTPTTPTTPGPEQPKPFAWLEDSMREVGSWWDNLVNQPWVKSLAAMAIGTYNIFIKPIVDWIVEEWNKFAAWFDETVIQPIKDGWETVSTWIDTNVIEPAKQMWADLNAFVDTKITEIGEWWNGLPLVQGFNDFFTWFNEDDTIENKITDVENWWRGVGENIGSAWEDGLAWFKDLPNKISAEAGNVWGQIQGVGAWLSTQWDSFTTWLTVDVPNGINQLGSDIWSGMQDVGDWLDTQGKNFTNWLTVDVPESIAKGGEDLWSGMQEVGGWLGTQGEKLGNWFDTEVVQVVSKGGEDLWNGMQGIPAWLDEQWTAFETWLKELPAKIVQAAGFIWESFVILSEWLDEQWKDFEHWLTVTVPQGIEKLGEDIWSGMQNIGDWLSTQWNNFKTWVTVTLPRGIERWGNDVWEDMQNIGSWLTTQWNNFKTWVTVTLPAGIASWGASVWEDMQDVGSWLSTQWNNFMTWMTVTLPAGIASWGASVWEDMQDVGDWLATQWESFMTWMTVTLPEGIAAWGAEVWEDMQEVGDWLATQWENFKTWVTVTLPAGIKQWGQETWASVQPIVEWLTTQWNNFKTWLTVTLPEGIKQWGANTWAGIQSIGEWLTTQWNNFKTWLTVTLPNGIVNWARNLWTNGLPNLLTWISDRSKEIENWLKGLPARIANWGRGIWDGLGGWFQENFAIGQGQARQTFGGNNATGGMIYRNAGGDVPGIGNTDTVPAMLTPGEFVINKRSTAKYRPTLKAMNAGAFSGGMAANRYSTQSPTYSPSNLSGGVYNVPTRGQASGTSISTFAPQTTTATQVDNPVYNYSLSVNVNGSNASADDIASTVIDKIKRIDSQRLRRQVVS